MIFDLGRSFLWVELAEKGRRKDIAIAGQRGKNLPCNVATNMQWMRN